jgi:hypothetical protein
MTTIAVAGTIADQPRNGGLTWARLNWILGLRKLGFDVFFLEQIAAARCTDTEGRVTRFEDSENLRSFKDVTGEFGLEDSATLIYDGGEAIHGGTRVDLVSLAERADLLVNISGHLKLGWLLDAFRCRAYIDDDPGFTQFWLAAGCLNDLVARHDFHFTFGENIGTAACAIPTGDIRWRPLRPFAVLEQWPMPSTPRLDRFTTVAAWRGPYGPVTHEGRAFGVKAHEFRKFMDLPSRSPQRFEIALDIEAADRKDRDALERHGWQLVDPATAAGNPRLFREYIQASGAECSVAKGIYVETHSGWFSDRTVCYLASGKPALVQDTGFSGRYPAEGGLVPFTTMEEAVAGARMIEENYEAHCREAHEIAEKYFDSDKVLAEFIDTVGVTP